MAGPSTLRTYDEPVTAKRRITVSIDADLADEVRRAVQIGRADSLSALVNDALRGRVGRELVQPAAGERGPGGLADLIREYEAEHGKITDEDLEENRRWVRARTIRVDGKRGIVDKWPEEVLDDEAPR